MRKPEPRFYEMACELLGVEPDECVFLDDLGINLKPAAAMGMTTIKVVDRRAGDRDLEAALSKVLGLTSSDGRRSRAVRQRPGSTTGRRGGARSWLAGDPDG